MSNKLDFSNELSGRRALITGGTRGIGATIARRLLDAGAKVVVAARTRNDDTPAAATFVAGDVTTSEGVEVIATKAIAALGGGPRWVASAPPRTSPRLSRCSCRIAGSS